MLVPENTKRLRNIDVIFYSQDVQSKFLMNTFSYFSLNFLKCFKLDILNFNYNQFFKEVTKIIKIGLTLIGINVICKVPFYK